MKKLTCILISFLTVFLTGCSCQCNNQRIGDNDYNYIFHTDYTEAEHLTRLDQRTRSKFSKELSNGTIVDYSIEILYAFKTGDPEYFLIELEYAEEWTKGFSLEEENVRYTTKYRHTVGRIVNDTYYYEYGYGGFTDGQSVYFVCGYADKQKYHGYTRYAVQLGDDVVEIYDGNPEDIFAYLVEVKEWDFEEKILKQNEQNGRWELARNPMLFLLEYRQEY